MQADARRTAGSRLSGGQGPQHSSSELQGGGGTRGHRCPGRRGKGGKGAHHPSIDCPAAAAAAAAVDADARWNWGRRLPLFSCQPRFRCSGKARLRCRVRECRRYFEDEGEQGDDLGPFPHTSALLRSGAAVQLGGGGGGGWMDIGESTLRSPLPQEFPPQHGQCSSRPPPPEGVCVTPFYWLGLFDAWLRWHVIGRREGWVEELTPPSSLPTPSKQAHGPVACTSKKMGLARPIEYLGQQCCCGRGQSTSSTLECLHRDGPFKP